MLYFFFFQAEDGIRDLVRSRGLGDVYKRQMQMVEIAKALSENANVLILDEPTSALTEGEIDKPVSYTHLTLPTSDLV